MEHTQVYIICKKLIEKGKTKGLLEKLSIFFLNNQITEEEYNTLVALIKGDDPIHSSSEEM